MGEDDNKNNNNENTKKGKDTQGWMLPKEREIEIEEEKEEEEKNERRRMRNGKRDGTSSLSLLGLAEFTYCTRSALRRGGEVFTTWEGGDSDLTETTTMINGTSSSSSISSNKSDL